MIFLVLIDYNTDFIYLLLICILLSSLFVSLFYLSERSTYNMIYSEPLNVINDIFSTSGTLSTQYNEDWTELTDKTRIYYDYKATRKFNSNNFVIERTDTDVIENKTYSKTFSYSNCN